MKCEFVLGANKLHFHFKPDGAVGCNSRVPCDAPGDACEQLSAMNATNHITTAYIRRIKYWQGEVGTLMLASKNIKACLLDISPK